MAPFLFIEYPQTCPCPKLEWRTPTHPACKGARFMTLLILCLVIFLGLHSTRVVADRWRRAQIARIGPGPWKLGYTVLSLIGFYLLLWGYGMARQTPVVLWNPPLAMRHVAGLLTL